MICALVDGAEREESLGGVWVATLLKRACWLSKSVASLSTVSTKINSNPVNTVPGFG